jgi:hypothetical protein
MIPVPDIFLRANDCGEMNILAQLVAAFTKSG